MKTGIIITILLMLATIAVGQTVVYSEDFEDGIESWTGKADGDHNGVVIADPLDATNLVLTFDSVNSCGDIFSAQFVVEPNATYELKFDYLGYEMAGSPEGNFGGIIGFADDLDCGNQWLAGTDMGNDVVVGLADDNQWHSYSIPFDPSTFWRIDPQSGLLRVVIEDWVTYSDIAGDSMFDNIRIVKQEPIPTSEKAWGRVKVLWR